MVDPTSGVITYVTSIVRQANPFIYDLLAPFGKQVPSSACVNQLPYQTILASKSLPLFV